MLPMLALQPRDAQRDVAWQAQSIHPARADTSFWGKVRNPLVCWLCGRCTGSINKYRFSMKSGAPPLQSARLLEQVRVRIRYLHYSLKTEKAYLYWVRFFVRWSATQPGGMRHPRDMSAYDVEAFLSMMANERRVSASTHNRAQPGTQRHPGIAGPQ